MESHCLSSQRVGVTGRRGEIVCYAAMIVVGVTIDRILLEKCIRDHQMCLFMSCFYMLETYTYMGCVCVCA